MKTLAAITVIALGVLAAAAARAADDKAALELQARDILKDACSACHKGKNSLGGRFNASIPQSMFEAASKDDEAVIKPGQPDDSSLWQVIDSGSMPMKNSSEAKRMTVAQRTLLRKWIEAGAPAWPADQAAPPRTPISMQQMLTSMREFLHNSPVDDRPDLRFYTLTHLYNQPRERVSDTDMDLYRAALSKATHYMIPPGSSMVTVWHRTNNESDSFLVTQYGKGAAGRIHADRSKVGAITVQFAIAWSGNVVPDAERGARDGGNETGFGPPIHTGVTEVARSRRLRMLSAAGLLAGSFKRC